MTRHVAAATRLAARNQALGGVRGIATEREAKALGTYPVPPDQFIWWKNRYQVPGGQIEQTVSQFQQKVMWQYFHSNPGKWWNRLSIGGWIMGTPCLVFYILMYKMCEADVEEDIRSKIWY